MKYIDSNPIKYTLIITDSVKTLILHLLPMLI